MTDVDDTPIITWSPQILPYNAALRMLMWLCLLVSFTTANRLAGKGAARKIGPIERRIFKISAF